MASYIQTTIHSKIAKLSTNYPDRKKPTGKESAASKREESTEEQPAPIATRIGNFN